MIDTATSFTGRVFWELTGPDGELKDSGESKNIITALGDQLLAQRSVLGSGPVAPTGMQIGTGAITPSKTGTGAALGTYTFGKAFTTATAAGTTGTGDSTRQTLTFVCAFNAGEPGTATTGIVEAAIVNGTVTTAGTTSTTLARTAISAVNKGTADTLTITWVWTIGS